MRGFLLDTHIWLWYLLAADQLPARLATSIDGAVDSCWLSPISVWETAILQRKRRIELEPSVREWVAKAFTKFPLEEAPLNKEVALLSREIDLPHQDPADRFIAASALVYDLVVMTVDKRLIGAEWLPTES